MNNDLTNILSNSNKDIDNQQLMDYLSQQLSAASAHEVEQQMADDPFVNDAVEGLQQMSEAQLQQYVVQLNTDLKKQVEKKKARRSKRQFKDQPWIYAAVLLLLLLSIICYIALKKLA